MNASISRSKLASGGSARPAARSQPSADSTAAPHPAMNRRRVQSGKIFTRETTLENGKAGRALSSQTRPVPDTAT